MGGLKFVNVHGEAVEPASPPPAQRIAGPRKKRVIDLEKAKSHHGFEVVGISQAALDQAERDFHQTRADRKLPKALFDKEEWLNKTKPKRAILLVFYIPEAAEQAAGMLRAGGGWHRVQSVAILKG